MVLLLHNLPVTSAGEGFAWVESDAGVMAAVGHVSRSLAVLGKPFRMAAVRRLEDVAAAIAAGAETTVFNLVERLDGEPGCWNEVPALCESLGRGCTGAGTPALLLTQDKHATKQRLAAAGVSVAAGTVVPVGAVIPWTDLPPAPLFVKPVAADASEGISALSLVRDPVRQLAAAVRHVHETCGQAALVEAYIDGREFNLAVMADGDSPVPLPVAEIDFSLFPAERPHVVDYEVKWHPGTIAGHVSPRRIPADIEPQQAAELHALACRVWHSCGCRDYCRIDCRADRNGRIHVLEANTNCDLSPMAGFSNALAAASRPFHSFVAQILENAERRRVGGVRG